MIWPRHDVIPIINKGKCTGCGLCTIDCPTGALTILQNGKEDAYQLLLRHDICNACGICVKSCPENSLRLETVIEWDKKKRPVIVIFKDKVTRCAECGLPLFPRAMMNRVKIKISANGQPTWLVDLCPSCRVKNQFFEAKIAKKEG